jgi:ABC-type multidrug transport system fused ATPase/permease subunit
MARALARNAPILILDEPTASMDVHSEAEMYSGFQKLAAGKTTLLISHRFSTVAMADHIYIMDDGRIVDHGSHDELLQRGGIYSAMYELHHRLSDRQSRMES